MEVINFVARIYPTPISENQICREEWYVVVSNGEKMNIILLDIYEDNKKHIRLWDGLL